MVVTIERPSQSTLDLECSGLRHLLRTQRKQALDAHYNTPVSSDEHLESMKALRGLDDIDDYMRWLCRPRYDIKAEITGF